MNRSAEPPVYSVTEFNELVNAALTEHVGSVLVEGEISGLTIRQNRWVSFDLKDQTSTLNCFAVRYRIGIPLEDGMRVRILGTPRIYVPYGKYSFNVMAIEPIGEGAFRRAYELLLKTLEVEGLFASEHKQPIPRFPTSIGIITSPDGAALGDVRRILRERWGGFTLVLAPVAVQGRTAAAAVVEAIEYFNQYQPVSTLIVTRGGGSLEDLQAFNDERVARAIYASRIPIIAAIGHEQDVTIAELVADQRAATPSNAAQLTVPDRVTVALQLTATQARVQAAIQRRIDTHDQALARAIELVRRTLLHAQQSVSTSSTRITNVIRIGRDAAKTRVNQIAQLFQALNPHAILGRGYSFTIDAASGTIVRSVKQAITGHHIQTRVSDGVFTSEVQ
ncbi:exodeoxyribonuclease VII large subunit [Candidatus Berkelbacteria bacterium]|nr:exodeoxyribonuclease VII large subunit [Candidatus Berkelbacteria bacterium]